MAAKPRVVLLRGHNANVWDLRPWERLPGDFDVSVLVTGSNLHQVAGLDLEIVPVRTPRDSLPAGRAAGAVAYALGERYLRPRAPAGAARTSCTPRRSARGSARRRRGCKRALGFRLVLTVWETIPCARRLPLAARARATGGRSLASADLLPGGDRARPRRAAARGRRPGPDRASPAGHRPGAASRAARGAARRRRRHVLSAGRLVWEKGHQDVLRALAALRGGLAGAPARRRARC